MSTGRGWFALVLALLGTVVASAAEVTNVPSVTLALPAPKVVATGLAVDADWVVVSVRLPGDLKQSSVASPEDARQALDLIARRAAESGRFHVLRGAPGIDLPEGDQRSYVPGWREASADLRLAAPLGKDGTRTSVGEEIARFVEGIRLPGRVKVDFGEPQLAVVDAERHRVAVLRQVEVSIQYSRSALTLMSAEVTGLELPVQARRLDERRVELYLRYKLTMSDPARR